MKKSALSDIFGGLIVLAIGLSFFLAANNVISWDKWWAYLLFFLGVVFIIEAIIRTAQFKDHLIGGRFIAGIILLSVGVSVVLSLRNWWPLILIVIGLLIIIKGIVSHQEETKSDTPKE